MRLFVGNLPRSYDEDKVREMFSEHGEVSDISVPRDRYTNAPRGFAFVEMPNDEEANTAMSAVHGTEHEGREIRVEEARPRRERRDGRGGFDRGSGYNRDRW
ncbi:RNA-binding protein [candidate division WOR-3 bacterium]|nr:RNA-binding protein [candidate division WOR-3 bacterium]